jgi:predicted DNA-binding protein (MmcQ/YjbR family)
MSAEWVRRICLSLPGVTEEILWGSSLVFKVSGRMFCVAQLEPGPVWLSIKVDEEEFATLTLQPGIVPAPYLARARWIALEHEDAMPPAELQRRIQRSWLLAAARLPVRVRARLNALRRPAPPASG